MVKRFCPKCGEIITTGFQNPGFFCKTCYSNQNNVINISSEYTITICENCHSFKIKDKKESNKWILDYEDDFYRMLKKAIFDYALQVPLEQQEIHYKLELNQESLQISNGNYVLCVLSRVNDTGNIESVNNFKVHIKNGYCINCVNLMGKRYSSIIQLRKGKKNESKIEKILSDIKFYAEKLYRDNPEYNIVDIIETNNGYDLKLSNIGILKKIHSYIESKYNFIVKKTKTLVGVNSNTGGNLYRTCLLLRTLPVEEGDTIEYKNEQYTVLKIYQKSVHLENAENKKSILKKFKFFEKKDVKLIQA